jgi:hypothetical protein
MSHHLVVVYYNFYSKRESIIFQVLNIIIQGNVDKEKNCYDDDCFTTPTQTLMFQI